MSQREPPVLEELLAPLREAYAERLPGHLETMRQLLGCIEGGDDRRDELRTLAHRLRGTAGTYGFAAVGAELAKVDDLIRSRGTKALSQQDVDELRQATAKAAAVIPR